MQTILYVTNRRFMRATAIILFAFLLGEGSLQSYPAKGRAAPSMTSLKLLQAPAGSRVDWAALKGKVVVLEFWATWCSPCVASLPHLNELVATLDPAKFQFISIDDEDTKAVQSFLTKKKMSGWVGLDVSGSVFHRYGVESRPTTFIIDGNGKIVAVTQIESVSADDLRAVAAGQHITSKPAMEIIEASAPSIPSTKRALFSVSISESSPNAKMAIVKHPPTGTDYLGQDADSLITSVFNIWGDRYVLKDSLPDRRYDLHVDSGNAPQHTVDSITQQAVLASLHLQIEPKTLSKPAYVLRALDSSKKSLSPSASTHSAKRGSWHDGYLVMNGTMDDFAYALATGLETPVINETGIGGTYDARFKVAGSTLNSINVILKANFGLELAPSSKEMSIAVLEVHSLDVNKAPPAITQILTH